MNDIWDALRNTYDRVAKHYVNEFFKELSRKPFDRELLDRFAEGVQGQGTVCEIGCGPGQIARYLKDRGADIFGIDLSEEMIAWARKLNADISFEQGNMLYLDASDDAWAGIVSFYAIIHLRRSDVPLAFAEFYRVLKPSGNLLVSFHGGEGEVGTEDWFGEPVSVRATLFGDKEIAQYLASAGFKVEDILKRPPYEFEYQTERVYVFATK